jgi:long-chain acyl-CoA synthetase
MVIGDDRPVGAALITLDPEALEQWKTANDRPAATLAELRTDPAILEAVQSAVTESNSHVSKAEEVKKFVILGTDFTEESGHLTPSLKVKRNLVARDYDKDIEALYH